MEMERKAEPNAATPGMADNAPSTHDRERCIEDALQYLDQIKLQFGDQSDVYTQFLNIMKDFQTKAIDTSTVTLRVSTLFHGHPDLIAGFNAFLPPGYCIQPDGTMEGPPESVASNSVTHSKPTISLGDEDKPTQTGEDDSAADVCDFDRAIHYVTTIKQRFPDEPERYQEFLSILHTYQKEQLSIGQVLDRISHLFRDHPDLIREFAFFLPDSAQAEAKELLDNAASKAGTGSDKLPALNVSPGPDEKVRRRRKHGREDQDTKHSKATKKSASDRRSFGKRLLKKAKRLCKKMCELWLSFVKALRG